MPQWKNTDHNANGVLWAASGVKVAPSSASRAAIYGNTTANAIVPGQTVGLFGVGADEVEVNHAIGHTGWVLKKTGSGGRAGRVQYEVLVAVGIKTDNAADNATLPNYRILFNTKPVGDTGSESNNEILSFTANTYSKPAGATVAMLWQYSTNAGATWTNASGAGFAGYQSNTLTAQANTVANGIIRVLASATGAINATSSSVTLTTTA